MGYNETSYAESSVNTGLQKCAENMGTITKVILAPAGTSFADFAAVTDFDTWEAAINDAKTDRIFVLPNVFRTTDETEEPVTSTGDSGQVLTVREEREMYTFEFEPMSFYNYLQLQKFNGCGGNWAFVFVYQKGQIGGQSSDGVKFEFRPIQHLYFNKRRNGTSDEQAKVSMKLIVGDGDLFHSKGVFVNPIENETSPWNPNTDLIGIKDCKITVANITATGLTATVTGITDNVPVTGLVVGDFNAKTSAGVAINLTSATEGDPGVYAIVYPTASGSNTIALENQPGMTTKYFETPSRTTFVIV